MVRDLKEREAIREAEAKIKVTFLLKENNAPIVRR